MLINTFLPKFQFVEKHHIHIYSSPEVIMHTIINSDISSDKTSKILMSLRELPLKFISIFHTTQPEKKAPFGLHSFLCLGQNKNEEIAFSLLGKFWQLNFGLIQLATPVEFQQFSKGGVAKLVMNFSIQTIGDNHCILSTETRVFCPDKKTLILFSPYWYLIRIASGFIRKKMLLQIKQKAESFQTQPV